MNLQARKISGSEFSSEDKIEVTFSSDSQTIASVLHTVELVSGVNVTHGGGGQPNEYLHYKSLDRDAESDGIIDYSNVEMALVQDVRGTSVIKVVCVVTTKADLDLFQASVEAYQERAVVAGVDEEHPLGINDSFDEVFSDNVNTTILSTGDITLEWSDDNFV